MSISETLLLQWLSPIFWPFIRVLAVFSVAPIFASRSFPIRVRVALALLVAWSSAGVIPQQVLVSLADPDAIRVVMHEILVGLSIGFSVRIVFAAAEFAGELIGLQMGLNFAGFFNPSSNVQSSAMAVFMGHMTALLFVVLNGHLMVLMAVVQSYKFVPLNSGMLELIQNWRLHEMGALIFSSAFWMALPVMVLLLLVNIALGIMSRVAPQMNIYAVGFPVTLTAGLVGLLILFPFMDRAFFALFELALENFGRSV